MEQRDGDQRLQQDELAAIKEKLQVGYVAQQLGGNDFQDFNFCCSWNLPQRIFARVIYSQLNLGSQM